MKCVSPWVTICAPPNSPSKRRLVEPSSSVNKLRAAFRILDSAICTRHSSRLLRSPYSPTCGTAAWQQSGWSKTARGSTARPTVPAWCIASTRPPAERQQVRAAVRLEQGSSLQHCTPHSPRVLRSCASVQPTQQQAVSDLQIQSVKLDRLVPEQTTAEPPAPPAAEGILAPCNHSKKRLPKP